VSEDWNRSVLTGHSGDMRPADEILWARVRADDPQAFGALFERHARAIYNYCFRMTGSWATAEDLLSTVFLEAWRRRHKELSKGLVLPWLYGIAANVVRNHQRSERRFSFAVRRISPESPEPDFSEAADGRLDDERQMRRALVLLDKLPRRAQDVFVLCAWMKLSYEDAAQALDLPVGTVRSRLSRARTQLRELDSAPRTYSE
jgi:RNA polymerase sigma factor (sigma-70 family)